MPVRMQVHMRRIKARLKSQYDRACMWTATTFQFLTNHDSQMQRCLQAVCCRHSSSGQCQLLHKTCSWTPTLAPLHGPTTETLPHMR